MSSLVCFLYLAEMGIDDDPPLILAPVVTLRSGEKYRNLSEYLFGEEEIRWICKQIRELDSSSPGPASDPALWAARYRIPSQLLAGWLRAYDADEPLFHVPADSPVDTAGILAIFNFVESGSADAATLRLMIEQQLDQSQMRRSLQRV